MYLKAHIAVIAQAVAAFSYAKADGDGTRKVAYELRTRKSLDEGKGALLYGVTRLPRSASCGAWMPVRTVILCVASLRTRGCTPCDASHLSLHNHERKPSVCQPVTSHGFLLSLHVLLDNAARMGYNHMNFL